MKNWVLWGLFLFLVAQNAYGQCSFTSVSGGTTASPLNWATGSTWSGGTAPSTSSPSGNVCIGNGTYTSVVRLAAASTFNSSVTINVQSNSTLIVNGDLHIASNITIVVQPGGTLTVNGSLITDNAGGSPTFTNLGTTNVVGITMGGTAVITNGSSSNNTAKITATGALAINNAGSPSLTNYGTINLSGSVDTYGSLTNSGTLTVGVDFTAESSGGQLTTNTGLLTVAGNTYAYGKIQLTPATSANSDMIITGSLTVNANENMKVGTGSACTTSAYYANLVVKTNVNLIGSGDIKVYSNGRLVVFGNIDGTTSTGTLVTVNCGGQAYVNGNINLGSGGGNTVANSNGASAPTGSDGSHLIGLYVNGTVTSQNNPGNDPDANTSVGTKSQLQSNDGPFYAYISGLSGSPLPVSLVFFNIKSVTEESITFAWATASELNFDYFNLQRSTDGKNFTTIAQIKGNGTTKEYHDYSFVDKLPISGTSYYRLQSVDFDKYTETFSVISSSIEKAREVTIYPVPVTDSNLSFHLNFEPKTEILVSVMSTTGVERVRGFIKATETDVDLNLESLEAGIYIVKMSSIDFNKVSRIVVK